MALDVQRPDPSSPAAVASAQFTLTRRGYREEEVRDFLRQVSVELARLLERERFLQNELQALQARNPIDVAAIDEASITALLGAEAARVLSAAREAAQAIRDRAAESAEQIVKEASREASRLLEESTVEASRRRTDVSSEAEQELELAKQQGREMVAEVRAYRERVLADVAKRTEEARRELERLVHERERLLSAFERARHAATDVVGDLNEFDEAIRGAGIVPPLVPPDAPPPPRPTRKTDTPIFDAKEYEDELGAGHVTTEPPATETAIEPDATPETSSPDVSQDVSQDVSKDVSPTLPAETSTIPPAEPPANTVTSSEPPRAEPSTPDQPMAPVVNIFDRQRKRNSTTPSTKDSDPASVATPPTEQPPSVKSPQHPVFERVEAEPPATAPEPTTPSSTTTSRVDEIFERLRTSDTRRVANKTEEDLATREKSKRNKGEAPKSTKRPAKDLAVRPRPVDASIFRRRNEAIAPFIVNIVRALKRVLADDENTVLTHIGTKRSELSLAAMLPAPADHARRFLDAVREDVLGIAADGARSLRDSRRADLRKVVSEGGVMESVAALLVSDLIRPLHDRITAAIEQSAGNRDELMKRARSEFAECKTQRLELVTADVAHLSYARGLFLGCENSPHVCWAVDPEGPNCADAEDNALAGRLRRGEAFPTGHEQPLAHAGCRCLVVPLDK